MLARGGRCWMLVAGCVISILALFTNELLVLQFWKAYEESVDVDESGGFGPSTVVLANPPPTPAATAMIRRIRVPSTILKVFLFIPHTFPLSGLSPIFRSDSS